MLILYSNLGITDKAIEVKVGQAFEFVICFTGVCNTSNSKSLMMLSIDLWFSAYLRSFAEMVRLLFSSDMAFRMSSCSILDSSGYIIIPVLNLLIVFYNSELLFAVTIGTSTTAQIVVNLEGNIRSEVADFCKTKWKSARLSIWSNFSSCWRGKNITLVKPRFSFDRAGDQHRGHHHKW